MPAFGTLTNETLLTDVTETLAAARADKRVDPARVGIIGFCVGGFTAFLAAEKTDVKAAVVFYGGGIVHERPGLPLKPLLDGVDGIESPMLLVFGGQDQSIPGADIDAIQERLANAGKTHTIVVMPEGGHGFACDERAAHHQASADEAWRITFEWLNRHLRQTGHC
jgi:carboxymethylenebutenolidase